MFDFESLVNTTKSYKDAKLKFIETKTIDVEKLNKTRIIINIPRSNNMVIKNLRIPKLIQNSIEMISLDVGGLSIDKLWNLLENNTEDDSLFDVLRFVHKVDDETIIPFDILIKDNYLPFLELDDIRFIISFTNIQPFKFALTYELYEKDIGNDFEFLSNSLWFTGTESLSKLENTYTMAIIKMTFMLPCKCLIINTVGHKDIIEKITFTFKNEEKNMELVPEMNDFIRYKNFYILNMAPLEDVSNIGLNFMNIDKEFLKIDLKCPIKTDLIYVGIVSYPISLKGGKYIPLN